MSLTCVSFSSNPMTKLLLPLAIACVAPFAAAQSCFSFAPGVMIGSATTTFSDVILPIQPIGFAFPLAGSTYTDIHVSDHGLAFLSNGGVPTPPVATPLVYSPSTASFTANGPMLCALWTDVVCQGTAEIWLDSQPTHCTVTWLRHQNFGIPTPEWHMQMTLLPSGVVTFAWSPGATNNSTFGSPSDEGICGVTPGGGAVLPAAVDLSAGAATPDNTVFEHWSVAGTFDMANTGLQLIPTNPGWVSVPLGAPTGCAAVADYGAGCGGSIDSVYQDVSGANWDLDGTTITWLRTASGYAVVNSIPGTYVPPGGGALPVASGALDGEQSFPLSLAMPVPGGTSSSVTVTTKGQVEVSGTPTGSIDWSPTVAELLNRVNTHFCVWHDLYQAPGGAGTITFEEVGGVAFVTFDGVKSLGSTLTNTFQFQLDEATGNVTLVIVSGAGISDPANIDACIVGYSVGGASADPGSTDLSAFAGAVAVEDVGGGGPMTQTTTGGLPAFGNSSFAYVVNNVPGVLPLAFIFFGDTAINPGIPLGFLGMPGCEAYSNLNLGSYTFPAIGSGTFPLPIPNNPTLVGITISAQTVAFSAATPAGLVTSNGTVATLGL